jgi:hypothetical protein
MTIIATCGHEIPDNDEKYSVMCKRYNRRAIRVVSSEMICLECQKRYSGDLLDTEAEEQAWLYGEGTA